MKNCIKASATLFFRLLFMLVLVAMCNSCTMGKDRTNKDSSKYFDIICIGGHQYYQRWAGDRGYLAIRLTDNGKPIRCGGTNDRIR